MNERDELSTADLAGRPASSGGYADGGATGAGDTDPEAGRSGGALDRIKRVFTGDDRHPDDAGADAGAGPVDRARDALDADDRGADHGADAGADLGADRDADAGADHGADAGAGPVDRVRDAFGADDRGADEDRDDAGTDRPLSAAEADDRLLPPPGGTAAVPVGAVAADRAADTDDDRPLSTDDDRPPHVDETPAAGAMTAPGPAATGAEAPDPAGAGVPVPAGAGVPVAAGAGTSGPTVDSGAVPTPVGADGAAPTTSGPLLPPDDIDGYRSRWLEVQTGFVDSPRQAVERADGLTAELMQHLARTFADERSRLEGEWDRGGDVATDDLRSAFQRYRSFFERLLST